MKELKTMTRKELEKLRKEVDKTLTKLEKAERARALEAADKAARAHGFSLADLTGGKSVRGGSAAKAKTAAKYRNPSNANESWSGRGRQPQWFKEALAAGQTPDQLEI